MPNEVLFCALQGREIKRRKQHRSELFYRVFIAAKIDIPNHRPQGSLAGTFRMLEMQPRRSPSI